MKRRRFLLIGAFSFLLVWLALCAVIGVEMTEWALHPPRRTLTAQDENAALGVALRDSSTLRDVAITASDGAVLRAWSIEPGEGNGETVILLHGQADNRAGMIANADLLLRHGFAVLMPDARAQGASGGRIATYGVKEVGDLDRWFAWVKRTESPRCIDGLGDSMGAAILLQTLATHPGFCAVVAESTFTSFREAAYDRLGQLVGEGPWVGRTVLRPAVEIGLLYSRVRYGVNLALDSPERAVEASKVPILLIHGLKDRNLPPWHSEQIKAEDKAAVLWEPAGAGHCGAASTAPQEYARQVIGWFESHPSGERPTKHQ
jgi:uncharacterized protein